MAGYMKMCTMTLIPIDKGLRVAFNRDESRKRPIAFPPRLVLCGDRSVLMPIDARSQGTWIGVNDAGLVMGILNRNIGLTRGSRDPNVPSRGLIIPSLLVRATLAEAHAAALELRAKRYAPFRLVIADRNRVVEIVSEPSDVTVCEYGVSSPLLFTSSGLGDELVEPPRRALFENWFTTPENWPSEQDAFHRHSWPNYLHLSVCMRREEACTVSFTTIELERELRVMTYTPGPPDEAAEATILNLLASR